MKKKIIIVITSIIIILTVLVIVIFVNDELRFKLSYEYINYMEYDNGKTIKVNIPLNNNIKYLQDDEIIDFLKSGTGIIYFGYNTCPWCRNIIEILLETANEKDVNTIYYVNTHDDLSKIKDELYELLDEYLKEDDKLNKRLSVPDVYFVKNGKIITHHVGTVDGYKNPYSGMNDSQINELKDIYKRGIEMINK